MTDWVWEKIEDGSPREALMKVNARCRGWTIRNYESGDYYATIYCPHGRPVEVINTDSKPILPAYALGDWMKEQDAESRRNYCYH